MIVYRHRRLDTNEIFYVGIGASKYRAYSKKSRNSLWKNIVNKVGYSVEIITTCETWEEACQIEQYLIKYYGRRDLGLGSLVNLTDGGEGRINLVVSDETRQKIRDANLGIKKSEETKAKISKTQTGKKHTEETRLKMSEARKGGKNPTAKKVINTVTGVIYDTIKEAAEIENIKYYTLKAQLTGKYKNKTDFELVEKGGLN